jgi:hypothetical protein
MKFKPKYIVAVISLILLISCDAEDKELLIAYPNDITFNELTLGRFTNQVYDEPFDSGDDESGVVTFNAVNTDNDTHAGFVLSNQNTRSYPWYSDPNVAPSNLTEAQKQQVIDSVAYSVYTDGVNGTLNFLVGNTTGDNAYFTLKEPGVVEHVLVANTTYNYLLMQYGSVYSASIDSQTQAYLIDGFPVRNPNIDNTGISSYGTFSLPTPDDVEAIRLSGHVILEKSRVGEIARAAVVEADAIAAGEAAGEAGAIAAGEAAGETEGEAAKAIAIAVIPALTEEEVKKAYDDAYAAAYAAAYDDFYDDDYTAVYDAAYYAFYEDAYTAAYAAYSTGYLKLTMEGYLNGEKTGTVDEYLAVRKNVDLENPTYTFTLNDWRKVDLTSLGQVDKVLFKMSSSYVDAQGEMIYPTLFCLDGIRLEK